MANYFNTQNNKKKNFFTTQNKLNLDDQSLVTPEFSSTQEDITVPDDFNTPAFEAGNNSFVPKSETLNITPFSSPLQEKPESVEQPSVVPTQIPTFSQEDAAALNKARESRNAVVNYWKQPIGTNKFNMPLDQFVQLAGMMSAAFGGDSPQGKLGAMLANMGGEAFKTRQGIELEEPKNFIQQKLIEKELSKPGTTWETYYNYMKKMGIPDDKILEGYEKTKAVDTKPTEYERYRNYMIAQGVTDERKIRQSYASDSKSTEMTPYQKASLRLRSEAIRAMKERNSKEKKGKWTLLDSINPDAPAVMWNEVQGRGLVSNPDGTWRNATTKDIKGLRRLGSMPQPLTPGEEAIDARIAEALGDEEDDDSSGGAGEKLYTESQLRTMLKDKGITGQTADYWMQQYKKGGLY